MVKTEQKNPSNLFFFAASFVLRISSFLVPISYTYMSFYSETNFESWKAFQFISFDLLISLPIDFVKALGILALIYEFFKQPSFQL